MTKLLLKKTMLLILIVSLLSAGITFGLDKIGLPEKAKASFLDLNNGTPLNSGDLILLESISRDDITSKELARFIAVENITQNPNADQLSLLIILLDLFPQNIDELSRLIATERTLKD